MKKENGIRCTGPGLFEILEDSNLILYDPLADVDYVLTDEEHRKFDSIEGMTKEEIENAKKTYIKLKGPQPNNSMEKMVEMIKQLWYDDEKNKAQAQAQQLYIAEQTRALYEIYHGEKDH